jgi:pimeloyl-ACP methyl ester carboxylesterase
MMSRVSSALASLLLTLAALVAAGVPGAPAAVPAVLAPPSGVRMTLSSPLDRQVFQRSSRDSGTIVFEGEIEGEPGDVVEGRIDSPGIGDGWRPLVTLAPGARRFRATLTVPAGGWYQVTARLLRGTNELVSTRIAQVGVGEVFVIAGQSNSANHGEERQTVKSGRVSAFTGSAWQVANDPQPGASGDGGSFVPPFGEALAIRFGVPIGIIAVGAGGTSVREWLPRGARFPNPPTVLANVSRLETGEWESKGTLFEALSSRTRAVGVRGFRAVLWHQGESDANQADPTRTLAGDLYTRYLGDLIGRSREAVGWAAPWFVAQVSYHVPEDPRSPEIRSAQAALWKLGVAMEGPDTDTLVGILRDTGGKGIHFSGPGLREHGYQWAVKVGSWLEGQLEVPAAGVPTWPPLGLPGTENFMVDGRRAFVFLPPAGQRTSPQPWVLYGPTLSGHPDEAERWMHERFLAAGVAVAGVDVGEAYGSPRSHAAFDALYRELTRRGFADRACLLGRSRGGLLVTSWGLARPERVSGVAGIYPVYDFRSYPGVTNAAPAYGVTPAELLARAEEFNPIARVGILAQAKVPVFLLHGDSDTVVPLKENSAEFARRYREAGVESLLKLVVLPGQGHNMYEGFFRSQELVDFVVDRARAR